jgi:hypothetical protein
VDVAQMQDAGHDAQQVLREQAGEHGGGGAGNPMRATR